MKNKRAQIFLCICVDVCWVLVSIGAILGSVDRPSALGGIGGFAALNWLQIAHAHAPDYKFGIPYGFLFALPATMVDLPVLFEGRAGAGRLSLARQGDGRGGGGAKLRYGLLFACVRRVGIAGAAFYSLGKLVRLGRPHLVLAAALPILLAADDRGAAAVVRPRANAALCRVCAS